MALNPPTPGLRHIHHDAVSFGKVFLSIEPGEQLWASDNVADQLTAASRQFKDVTDTGVPEPPEPQVVEEDADEPDDLDGMTKAELYERATELDIEGRSDMNKAELVAAIRAA